MHQSSVVPRKQIRPKNRSRKTNNLENDSTGGSVVSTKSSARLDQDNAEFEDMTQRMESWMGLAGASNGDEHVRTGSTGRVEGLRNTQAEKQTAIKQPIADRPAKSILRTPKYTKSSHQVASTTSKDTSSKLEQPSNASSVPDALEAEPPTVHGSSNAICKDSIVERDPSKPMLKRKIKSRASHSAVEGYVPSAAASLPTAAISPEQIKDNPSHDQGVAHQSPEENLNAALEMSEGQSGDGGDDPLILNSLEDLFRAAGETPYLPRDPHKITSDTKLLEADVSFSVMTQNQYNGKLSQLKEQQEEERQAQLRVFMGTEDIFEGDTDDDHEENSRNSDDEEEDGLLDMLMDRDDEDNDDFFDDDGSDEEEEVQARRAFRLLWDTLSEWVTPEAAQYISHLKASTGADADNVLPWTSPYMDRNDIEASRCAGLMAMVKLYLPKCLDELGYPSELRRTADGRLGELLRTFSYALEAPKLPVRLWKAMTCILLEIVLVEHNSKGKSGGDQAGELPPSVALVDMTMEEYRYLSQSSMETFCSIEE